MNTRTLLLLGLSLISVSFSAAAGDLKVYPGAMCQPEGNSQPVKINARGGYAANAGTSTQVWFCPIIRDIEAGGDVASRGIEYAEVVVGSLEITCELFSRTSAGTLIDKVNSDGNFYHREHLFVLKYPTLNAHDIPEGAVNYYHFRCVVPPGAGVISYRVDELTN
jgi:hypothetical protein